MSGHIHALSSSHSLVFLLNSRLGHFSAATSRWLPFSRSYRVILPSSLAAGHSSALVSSTGPPVSVCGTGRTTVTLRSFSRKHGYVLLLGRSLAILSGSAPSADLPAESIPTPFSAPIYVGVAALSLFRPSFARDASSGMLTGCPSVPPFGLSLGPDSP